MSSMLSSRILTDEVGLGLHQGVVQVEGRLHQVLSVTCAGCACKRYVRELLVEGHQEGLDGLDRVAVVWTVAGQQQIAVLADDAHLYRSGSGVDSKVGLADVGRWIRRLHAVPVMPLSEEPVVLIVLEQRLELDVLAFARVGFDALDALLHRKSLAGLRQRCSQGDIVERVLRADALRSKRLVEPGPESRYECQRTSEIDDASGDLTALCETCYGLVDDGHEDGCRDVLDLRPLVDQGLDIRLGEYSATACDRVCLCGAAGVVLHVVASDAEQRRHLVDEGSGSSGAAAVHPHFESAGEEEDLGVLSAKLDYCIRVWNVVLRGVARRIHLLDERDAAVRGKSHSCRAGNRDAHRLILHDRQDALEHLLGLVYYLGQVPLVLGEQYPVVFIEHDDLDGRRPDIYSHSIHIYKKYSKSVFEGRL